MRNSIQIKSNQIKSTQRTGSSPIVHCHYFHVATRRSKIKRRGLSEQLEGGRADWRDEALRCNRGKHQEIEAVNKQ